MKACSFVMERRRGWLAGWCLLILLAATAWADPGSLSGQVVAAETRESLAGASVRVTGPALTGERGAYTDGQGRYAVGNLPAGTYRVAATFVGYQEQVVEGVEVAAGQAATVDLRLIVAPYGLGEIVVSASRHAENIIDAPASVSKLEREEITRNAAGHSYSSLLRNVKGVDYTQTGMFAEAFNTRGFNSGFNNRMVTLLDGIPFSPPAALTVGLPLPKGDLQDMEVLVGPGSALYGPGAVNGIISLTSSDPRSQQGTTVTAAGGSRSLARGQLRHAGLTGRWGWKVAADYQQAHDFAEVDTYYTADRSRWVTDDPDLDTGSKRGSVGLYYYPDAQSSLGLKLAKSQADVIDMFDSGRCQRKDIALGYQQLIYSTPHRFVNLFRRTWSDGGAYTLHGYAKNRLAGMSEAEARNAAAFSGTMEVVGAQTRWTSTMPLLAGARITLGADYQHERDAYSFLEGGELILEQLGVYALTEVDLERRFRVVLAGRGDFPESFGKEFSPKAALIYRASPSTAVRITYNRAYRTPGFTNLTMALPIGPNVYARGNLHGFQFGSETGAPLPEQYQRGVPPVAPERNTTYELGFKGELSNRVFLDVSAYRSQYKDFISPAQPISDPANGIVVLDAQGNLRTGELTYTYLNFGRRTVTGLDLATTACITEKLLVKGNASLVHAGPMRAAAGFNQPFNTPGRIINLIVSAGDLRYGRQTLDLSLRYVGTHDFRTVGHIGTVPGYTVLDATLAHVIHSGWTARLTVSNLLDNEHIEFIDAPRIGRLMSAELEYRL